MIPLAHCKALPFAVLPNFPLLGGISSVFNVVVMAARLLRMRGLQDAALKKSANLLSVDHFCRSLSVEQRLVIDIKTQK